MSVEMSKQSSRATSDDSDYEWPECILDSRSVPASEYTPDVGTVPAGLGHSHHGMAVAEAEVDRMARLYEDKLSLMQKEVEALKATVAWKEAENTSMQRAEELRKLEAERLRNDAAMPCERCVGKDVRITELERMVDTLTEAAERSAAAMKQSEAHLASKLAQEKKLLAQVEEMNRQAKQHATASAAEQAKSAALSNQVTAAEERVKALEAQVKEFSTVKVCVAMKSEHVTRSHAVDKTCSKCDTAVTVRNWFCCHECEDCNFCRRCFETEGAKHVKGTHTFTDMSVFDKKVVNTTLCHITKAGVGNSPWYHCSICRVDVYPHQGAWYRCNECDDVDFCAGCFERYYDKHVSGTHSFTDMSTFASKKGYPRLFLAEDPRDRPETRPKQCTNCQQGLRPKYLRCGTCTDYFLCKKCAWTDVWRTHSEKEHTFYIYRLV